MFPVTFVFEWFLAPLFGFIFLFAIRGPVSRGFSIFFFILSFGFIFVPQFYILFNETAGTATEITLRPYPTAIILLGATMHLGFIVYATELLFDDIGRLGPVSYVATRVGRRKPKTRQ